MKKEKITTLLTRVFWCQKCADKKMPQKGNLFLTIGRGRQKYEVHKVSKRTPSGYVPHIIEKTHVENSIVTFIASCAMNGCETVIEPTKEAGKYRISLLTGNIHEFKIKDWNALVNYTRDPNYFLG